MSSAKYNPNKRDCRITSLLSGNSHSCQAAQGVDTHHRMTD
ncbi:uncharacterized protein RCO7_15182 [Rhynchosporium graminicola]|uniref:Uncharacterized protein n=2 Tax=Rhynchosporium TaxID=38037 RepID=A0A1E1MPA2_RHYSE|nr:uncharacterized protein RCO7_15182 [Rhynchosporium commune]CZT50927.1 uncharacterized protein RSE6_12001 [Rhynchosporium secalis]